MSELKELSPEMLTELRERALEDFYFFTKGILGYSWLTTSIHRPVCDMLEDYTNNTRVRLVLPRGWLKSTICSIAYPIWRAVRNNNVRVLICMNTFTNSVKKLAEISSQILDNQVLKVVFPELKPGKTWRGDALCIEREISSPESTFEAAGIRTQVTSRHYDVIIEDDTVAPDLDELSEMNIAPKKEDIEQAIGWHRLAPPLLVSPSKSQIVVVGTRWYVNDLMSWIDTNEPNYKRLSRSCLEDEQGESDPDGMVTYPERFDREVLKELETSMGPYMFSCLYLNRPVAADEMEFRQEWIQYYETPPKDLVCYTSVDPAGDPEDTKGDPDWNVVETTGKSLKTGEVFVLQYDRMRCSPSELIDTIFRHVRQYSPVVVKIESVAYQKSLMYWIRERMRKLNTYFMIKTFHPGRKSKNARIRGLQPLVKAGLLKIRPHMSELIAEMTSFPLGKYDDVIDCLSMQLEEWALTRLEPRKEELEVYDPLSVEQAVKEMKERRKEVERRRNPVYDVLGEEQEEVLQMGYGGRKNRDRPILSWAS